MKFLVIEDEYNIYRIIESYLTNDGNEVLYADDGIKGLEMFYSGNPDFIILDLMLPGLDGLEICEAVRQKSDVPIIMLTARGDVDDRVKGLKTGADDYIPKPFSPRELMARIDSVLRRYKSVTRTTAAEGILIDEESRTVAISGEFLDLTVSEYEIIKILYKNPRKVFTREELINIIKGKDAYIIDRGIDVHIANLRKKMGCDSRNPRYVKTVWGVGYRL